mmetsp:Transcript_11502/g.36403  ORF Transcript_11502/g.36403 Transcript_11502/m.36403 type:complete len:264 (-) Transcript_11502:58-849(-)
MHSLVLAPHAREHGGQNCSTRVKYGAVRAAAASERTCRMSQTATEKTRRLSHWLRRAQVRKRGRVACLTHSIVARAVRRILFLLLLLIVVVLREATVGATLCSEALLVRALRDGVLGARRPVARLVPLLLVGGQLLPLCAEQLAHLADREAWCLLLCTRTVFRCEEHVCREGALWRVWVLVRLLALGLGRGRAALALGRLARRLSRVGLVGLVAVVGVVGVVDAAAVAVGGCLALGLARLLRPLVDGFVVSGQRVLLVLLVHV